MRLRHSFRYLLVFFFLWVVNLMGCNEAYHHGAKDFDPGAAQGEPNPETPPVPPDPPAPEEEEPPLPKDPTTGGIVDPSAFRITVTSPSETPLTIHRYGQAWDQPCEVKFEDSPSDIQCVIEGVELGLYAFLDKLKMTYNVPSGLCDFVELWPYFFYQKPAGFGPSAVDITVTDGTPSLTSVTNTTPGITAVLDKGGAPLCTANYENDDPPTNCCEGEYVLSKHAIDTTTNPPIVVTTVTPPQKWGGKIGACLKGPAITTQQKDKRLFPLRTIIDSHHVGIHRDYDIVSPLSQGYFTNLYLANYFDLSQSFDANGAFQWNTAPAAMQGLVIPTNPWYEFSCLDEGDDYLHRIRVLIRSWSTEKEYNLGVNGAYDLGRDGAEEAYFKQQYLLDRYGWFSAIGGTLGPLDLMLIYPGEAL